MDKTDFGYQITWLSASFSVEGWVFLSFAFPFLVTCGMFSHWGAKGHWWVDAWCLVLLGGGGTLSGFSLGSTETPDRGWSSCGFLFALALWHWRRLARLSLIVGRIHRETYPHLLMCPGNPELHLFLPCLELGTARPTPLFLGYCSGFLYVEPAPSHLPGMSCSCCRGTPDTLCPPSRDFLLITASCNCTEGVTACGREDCYWVSDSVCC